MSHRIQNTESKSKLAKKNQNVGNHHIFFFIRLVRFFIRNFSFFEVHLNALATIRWCCRTHAIYYDEKSTFGIFNIEFFSLCLHAAHMSGCIFIVECKQLLITYTGANVSTACCMHIAQHTARDHGVLCTRCTVLNKRVHGAHEKLLRGKNYICSYTLDFIW